MTFLLLLVLGACDCGESTEVVPIPPGPIGGSTGVHTATPPPQAGTPIAPVAVPTNELMLLAGSKATITLALRLDKWSEAMAALRALAGPALPPEMIPLLSFDRPEALMAMAGREAAAMSQVDGLDRARPILVRIGEAPDDFSAAIATGLGQAPSPLRHVVVIPATQSAVLRASLAEKASSACRGLSPSTFDCNGMTLSLFEHGTWVLAALSRSPIASVQDLITAPGTEGTLAWALDASRPMSAHVRVREARAFAMFYGAEDMANAMSRINRPSRSEANASGIESIFGAFIHMSEFGQEVDTFALSLRASPASLLAVAQFTPTGERRLGLPTSGIAAQVSPSMVTIRSRYDLRSIANAAPDAFAFGNAQRPRDVGRPLRDCGPGCMLRVIAEPFGYAHTVGRIGSAEFDGVFAIQHRSDFAPGVIDVEIDTVRVADEAGEPDLRRMAQAVPRVHLHSEVRGRMWAGAMGHTPNLPLELAAPGASRPDSAPTQAACFDVIAQSTLLALESIKRTPAAQRVAAITAAAQVLLAQIGCVTDERLRGEAGGYMTALQEIGRVHARAR
ncbi:MAG: hypothetical protein ACI9KE_006369 [Polyangiales bacterium]|jgi:hypothetical protein